MDLAKKVNIERDRQDKKGNIEEERKELTHYLEESADKSESALEFASLTYKPMMDFLEKYYGSQREQSVRWCVESVYKKRFYLMARVLRETDFYLKNRRPMPLPPKK